jgi:hypothetical protein
MKWPDGSCNCLLSHVRHCFVTHFCLSFVFCCDLKQLHICFRSETGLLGEELHRKNQRYSGG